MANNQTVSMESNNLASATNVIPLPGMVTIVAPSVPFWKDTSVSSGRSMLTHLSACLCLLHRLVIFDNDVSGRH